MPVNSTVLFDLPQKEVASLLVERIRRSLSTSIVTGFATPGGLAAIAAPIKAQARHLDCLVVGAATYPAFEALEELISAGVPADRLYVHLGHTAPTGWPKKPFVRFHPMLHSKVYYMELSNSEACAFIGSHNVTAFALTGLNGEAAVMLEGPASSPEFEKVRRHIATARDQAVSYTPALKEAYAWWSREFIDGLKSEIGLPQNWTTIRTILIFAQAETGCKLRSGDQLYFEIPAGIEQIENLRTEVHLFLFRTLPADPWEALSIASSADARYTCRTLGAENRQGNREVVANWRIEQRSTPILRQVPSGIYRPTMSNGMQQVRAEVEVATIAPYEYRFERERSGWDPEFSDEQVYPSEDMLDQVALVEARGSERSGRGWRLVKGLVPRLGSAVERDQAALELAAPESGSFLLVSLRRRETNQTKRRMGEY
ncbi:phospholipase D family protein [Microvirga massiliensis]|uniref:phospholipase D family protein n=1 Tax=Microvirga massiliensis TaxID=1033741 RepID=UPI00062BCDC0|nr:phospholipase D family protein [Microvirga massiliensis]